MRDPVGGSLCDPERILIVTLILACCIAILPIKLACDLVDETAWYLLI